MELGLDDYECGRWIDYSEELTGQCRRQDGVASVERLGVR